MIKQSVTVAIGMGVGPLIQLIATPLLSRMYSPAEFGYFALFVSTVTLFSTITCLRYETAIPVVQSSLLKSITVVALVSVLVTTLFAIVVLLSGIPQKLYPLLLEIGDLIWWMPATAASTGLMLLVYYLTLRYNQFKLNAAMRSLQPILFTLLAIGVSGYGLIQAQITSCMLLAVVGLIYLGKNTLPFQSGSLIATALNFRHYPMLLAPTALLDAGASVLPLFFISSTYGVDATGHYAQVLRIVSAPLLLASAVFGQMFFKYSGELYRDEKSSRDLMWRTVKILTAGAFLVLLTLTIIGEPLFNWFLGGNWRSETVFLLLVTFPLMCRIIVSPITTVFLTHHKVKLGVSWQIGYFVSTCSVLYLASHWFDFETFLLIFGVHELVMYLIYLTMANRVASSIP